MEVMEETEEVEEMVEPSAKRREVRISFFLPMIYDFVVPTALLEYSYPLKPTSRNFLSSCFSTFQGFH